MLVEHLREHAPEGTLEAVLAEAGDTRELRELLDDGAWSSYAVFRRFLEAAARALGGAAALVEVGRHAPLIPPTSAQRTEMLQALGSPAALYETIDASGKGLTAIVDAWPEEVDETCWIVHQRIHPGFEAFPEYCALVSGLIAMTPMLFGFPAGDVVETECECLGAPQCSIEVRWQPVTDTARRAEYFEKRAELLEARLVALQGTVNDLVSADSVEGVLRRVIMEAGRAVPAPGHVLALAGPCAQEPEVYGSGLNAAAADTIGREVLATSDRDRVRVDTDAGRLIVPVASTRGHYGYLCAIDPAPGRFFAQEIEVLEAYASMAAAALDSASALEEARRDATATRVMLELSTSLAEIGSIDEMAERLARAVPGVVDCDRAIVALADPDTGRTRVAATYGYPAEVVREVESTTFDTPTRGPMLQEFMYTDVATAPDMVAASMAKTGTVAMATVPITVNAALVGSIIVGVTERAHRLRDDAALRERLRGLAAQAASAVQNARLLDQIRHQALHDALTGLPNRALILDRVENMLARARRRREPAAALFLDLDGFKTVNDTLGHEAGDRLLQAVAARVSTTLRDGDTIGRLGGDEFIVLVEGTTSEHRPDRAAQRILKALRAPFDLDDSGPSISITASIGIAAGDRLTASELLRDADVALYSAKEAGKNRSVTFVPEMQTAVQEEARLNADLRVALDRQEYFLEYQPIFDLQHRQVTGVEALLRWRHPERGVVQPGSFIPFLEESRLIVDVGRWVLFEACRQSAALRQDGHDLAMSINVSARQLETDEVVADLRDALTLHAVDPQRLTIEITETTIMRDPEAAARRLGAMKGLGVRIAIDDFGTGYSSLAYIRQFPIDVIKIDRSFVSAMAGSHEADTLVHTLVQLGKSLGLETLAEGIEETNQFDELQRQECDSGQGFLLARPLSPRALQVFLNAHVGASST